MGTPETIGFPINLITKEEATRLFRTFPGLKNSAARIFVRERERHLFTSKSDLFARLQRRDGKHNWQALAKLPLVFDKPEDGCVGILLNHCVPVVLWHMVQIVKHCGKKTADVVVAAVRTGRQTWESLLRRSHNESITRRGILALKEHWLFILPTDVVLSAAADVSDDDREDEHKHSEPRAQHDEPPRMSRSRSRSSPQHGGRLFGDEFASDVEHRCHEFLSIAEVCLLMRVANGWRRRIQRALRDMPWDAVHCNGVDPQPHVWVSGLVRAQVNIRSLVLADPGNALAHAVQLGLLQAARTLVEHFPEHAITSDLSGRTPLHRASNEGHVNVVKFLTCLPNVDVNTVSSGDWTPMCFAAREGHVDVVKILTSLPKVNVNEADTFSWTAMHHAAEKGHVNVVKFLTSLPNVDVNAADNGGWTPIHHAANEGHVDVVKVMASFPNVHVNAATEDGWKPMHFAARRGHVDVVKFLTSLPNVDVNAASNRRSTPMHFAVRNGEVDVVKYLAAFPNVNVNAAELNRWTPMHYAARGGHVEIVNVLGSVPNVKVNAADIRGMTPMHLAARGGHFDVVKILTSLPKVKVNAADARGRTPSDYADEAGHVDVVKLLTSRNIFKRIRRRCKVSA